MPTIAATPVIRTWVPQASPPPAGGGPAPAPVPAGNPPAPSPAPSPPATGGGFLATLATGIKALFTSIVGFFQHLFGGGTSTAAAPSAAPASRAPAAAATATAQPAAPAAGTDAQKLITSAQRFLGIPYQWGGGHAGTTFAKPGPVDCSGLVQQAARMAGLGNRLDGTAAEQQAKGTPIPMSQLRPGDLVFVGTPAHHVGIYVGNGRVLEAPHTGDVVKYTSLSEFDSARRVF